MQTLREVYRTIGLPHPAAFRVSAVYAKARLYGYHGWVGDPAVNEWFANGELTEDGLYEAQARVLQRVKRGR